MSETWNCALIDSGASKTVCGIDWLNVYLDSIPHEDANTILYSESNSFFKFGMGNPVKSLYSISLPISIGNIQTTLTCDVIDAKIPLLFSRDSLKSSHSNIDFVNDKINILDQNLDLVVTKSGHYAIPISHNSYILHNNITPHLTLFAQISDKNVMAKKLHRQFGHPKPDKLIKLLKSAKEPWKSDFELFKLIQDLSDNNCDICVKYKKAHLRPAVCLPLATFFQEVLAMDLKFYKHLEKMYIILHIIDYATRFSSSSIVPSKKPDEIVKAIMTN